MNNEIGFHHIREYEILEDNTRVVSGKGGMTVAFREVVPGLMEYTWAACNVKDNFSRRIGRDISSGRLLNDKGVEVYHGSYKEFLSFLNEGV